MALRETAYTDYTSITELPGSPATREQLARFSHRYHTAACHARGRRVLEIACGAGLGTGYLAEQADRLVAGDYTESLLKIAHDHYRDEIPLVRFDAHSLPFREDSFDLAVLFEAIYYLARPEEVLTEIRRVLAGKGLLLIATVNKDWSGFSPSEFSTRYFSVPELVELLVDRGFDTLEVFGAFPTQAASSAARIVTRLRAMAVALGLVPGTLAARRALKRLFYGKLTPMSHKVVDQAVQDFPLMPIPGDESTTEFKVYYVLAGAG